MAAIFEIVKTNSGKFTFQLKAGNGDILLRSSQTYIDKKGALNGIESLKSSESNEMYDERVNMGGEVVFVMKQASAEVRHIAADAEIQDLTSESSTAEYVRSESNQYVREGKSFDELMTLERHIEITPGVCGGKPRVAGRRITVQNIAVWHERLGMSVDEIASEHDISLADVHAALAYYHDNRSEIEESIARGEGFVKEFMAKHPSRLKQLLDERKD